MKNTLLIILLLFPIYICSQNYNAEVIRYKTLIENGKDYVAETDSITIQINDRVGDEYTKIAIPYSKIDRISNLEAWIETMDGNRVRELKKSDVIDRSAISGFSLYEDDFIRCFQLKHNVYPYRVVYTYRTISRPFIVMAYWTPVLYDKIPTRNAELKVVIPKGVACNRHTGNMSACKVDSSADNYVLEWKSSYDKPVKPEIFSQPENCKPMVDVQPLNIDYGVKGSLADWKSYGNWQYRLIQGLDVLPEDEKKVISALVSGVRDKREIVKILYHYLQDHTRYVNVAIGIGGMKPYPASYVAKNKYGDCKALSNYMKAMLKFVGIESFYVNVYAGKQPRDMSRYLSGPFFNHIVLAVPLDNDTIWLENTSNVNPFGYVGTFTQNRDALLVSRDDGRLVHIPALSKYDDLVSHRMEFDLDTKGSTRVVLEDKFRGPEFEYLNEMNSLLNDDQKDKYIRENMPFDNYEVIYWGLKKPHRDTTWIELNAELKLKNVVRSLGKECYFNLYPVEMPEFEANRELPVELPYPIFNADTLVYNLPAGYGMKGQPDSVSLASVFGDYTQKTSFSGGKIVVLRSLELFPGKYTLERYPEFYKFLQAVRVMDKKKIVLKNI